jgi:aspartate kinase
MSIAVLKFGGTSVQDAPAISRLVEIVQSKSGKRLVVVSALAGVTNALVEIVKNWEENKDTSSQIENLRQRHCQVAKDLGQDTKDLEEIFSELSKVLSTKYKKNSTDAVYATGELASSTMVAKAFKNGTWIDARKFILTNDESNNAQVDFSATNTALKNFPDGDLFVSQGFIGSTDKGITTTLGRGGSDYSAAVFGAGLGADKVEIWTDVDGILSTDPRIVSEATALPTIHFQEASEMAYFGAKVLHPATIYPAIERKIPVVILNSKNPTAAGTTITFDNSLKSNGICGIAFKKNIALVNIYSTRMLRAHGFLKSLFDVFAKHKLSVDLISTSEVNVSLTLDPNSDPAAIAKVKTELGTFADVEVNPHRAMISVIGGGIRTTSGIAKNIFGELSDTNVQMISMGASELNISFVVNTDECDDVVRRLHKKLIPTHHSHSPTHVVN